MRRCDIWGRQAPDPRFSFRSVAREHFEAKEGMSFTWHDSNGKCNVAQAEYSRHLRVKSKKLSDVHRASCIVHIDTFKLGEIRQLLSDCRSHDLDGATSGWAGK